MKNIADSKEYKTLRKGVEKFFTTHEPIKSEIREYISPSGNYRLVVTPYDAGKGYWNYLMGVIFDIKKNEELFVILRNYGSFQHQWLEHSNGNEYLFCGEDYQGYVCLNLTQKKKHVYFPESGLKGWGFCWASYEYCDSETLIIEGCYWGAPYERVEYDISNPDELPYKELSRHDVVYEEDIEDDDDEEDEEDVEDD